MIAIVYSLKRAETCWWDYEQFRLPTGHQCSLQLLLSVCDVTYVWVYWEES